jgi:hypothetical protein
LNGAKERLRSGAEEQRPADRIADVRARLMGIRQSLLELRERC